MRNRSMVIAGLSFVANRNALGARGWRAIAPLGGASILLMRPVQDSSKAATTSPAP